MWTTVVCWLPPCDSNKVCPGLGVQKPNCGIPRINRINALWHLLLKNILSCSSQHVDVKWRIQLHTKHISKKNIQQPINGIYIYWMKVFTTNSGIPLLWAACDRLLVTTVSSVSKPSHLDFYNWMSFITNLLPVVGGLSI